MFQGHFNDLSDVSLFLSVPYRNVRNRMGGPRNDNVVCGSTLPGKTHKQQALNHSFEHNRYADNFQVVIMSVPNESKGKLLIL